MSNNGLPEGWCALTVGDLAEVIGGSTPSRGGNGYFGGSIAWATPTDITALGGKRYISTTAGSITEAGRAAAGLRVLPAGTILMTSRATIGDAAIAEVPMTTNQGFQSLVPNDGVAGLWLFYAVTEKRALLNRLAAGSTFKEVSRGTVRKLEVLTPPSDEQRRIAGVLDAIDAAIEKTEAVIAATESFREGLLGELLTRGVPGWHTEWKQVPGIGTIPACWEVVRLGDVVREPIKNGYSAHEAPDETGWWILTLAAVTSAGFDARQVKPVIADDQVIRSTVVSDDLLVSRSNTRERVGLCGIYRGEPSNCSYPDLLMRVRPDTNQISVDYLESVLLAKSGRSYFSREARGTSGSMVKIDRDILMRFPVPLPSPREQARIILVTQSARGRRSAEGHLLKGLQSSKARVASALLSGRVRV